MSLIKEIKTKRLSKEERLFLETIDGMKIKEQTKYHDSVFWEKNGQILFIQDFKDNNLRVDYDKIWSIFSSNSELNFQETSDLFKGLVEKHLNWKGLTPLTRDDSHPAKWRNI